MQPISPQRKNTKKIILGLLAVVIIGTGVLTYVYRDSLFGKNNPDGNSVNYDSPTEEQKDGEGTAEQPSDPNTSNPPASNDTEQDKKTIGIDITAANQFEDTVQIRALIRTVTNDGTCTLTLSKSGSTTVLRSTGVSAATTYSVCKGFDINTADLSPGNWKVTVVYENTNSAGTATSTVKVE